MNTKLSIKIAVFMNASCVVLAYLSNFNKRHYANEVTFFALEQIELRELKFRVFCVIFSYDELKYAMKSIFCLTAYLICRIWYPILRLYLFSSQIRNCVLLQYHFAGLSYLPKAVKQLWTCFDKKTFLACNISGHNAYANPINCILMN